MAQSKKKIPGKRAPRKLSKLKLVVEVDGKPVGVLDIDWNRLWPEVNHRKRESPGIEWIRSTELDALAKATMLGRFTRRLERRLYQGLGDEMVRAELDIENFFLRLEAAAQVFGTTRREIDEMLAFVGVTETTFKSFLWEYVAGDADIDDIESEWKALLAEREAAAGRRAKKPRPS